MRVGLLGLQGAFLDHIKYIEKAGHEHLIVKDKNSLKKCDRIILPGGESTVMKKYLEEFDMKELLSGLIKDGLPVWGICAGSIILAKKVDGKDGVLSVIDAELKRNAYGRQLSSKIVNSDITYLNAKKFPLIFIRAPKIEKVGSDVDVHLEYDGSPIFVQHKNVMLTTFHPELSENDIFHSYFFSI